MNIIQDLLNKFIFYIQAQRKYEQPPQPAVQPLQYPPQDPAVASDPSGAHPALYPSLGEYMGLQITPELVAQNMPVVPVYPEQVSFYYIDLKLKVVK